jgi:hypothetical protein
MNTLTRRLAQAAAAASALALIPLAATGARAATAPDPCKVPMAFVGTAADRSSQAYYRPACDQPAVQLTSTASMSQYEAGFATDAAVLMPGGQDVLVSGGPDMEIVKIDTQAVTVVQQAGGPTTLYAKHDLSVSPDGSAIAFSGGQVIARSVR